MKTKIIAVSMATLMACGTLAGCDMIEYKPAEDATKTYLYIDTPVGGFGTGYLEKVAQEFMAANSKKSYAEGKEGVVIEVSASSSNNADGFKDSVKNAPSDIHVVEGLYYTDLLNETGSSLVMELTDVVRATLSDNKTIESKLNTEQKDVLQDNGKYYALPTFAGYTGLTYNADLLADNNFYFANSDDTVSNEISSYTNKAYTGRRFIEDEDEQKSPGPDGILDTDDDGLPSSYEEFFYLCDKMQDDKITPLIFYNGHYTNYLFQELLCAASTSDALKSMFSFDSNGNGVEVITGWNQDSSPKLENVVITQDNGYYSTMLSSRYKALKFLNHLSTYNHGSYIYGDSRGKNLTNTGAQEKFMESYLNDQDSIPSIGMLLEGVYWYNEAVKARNTLAGIYGQEAANMNLKYMPLPAQETGTVQENKGTTQLVADAMQYYLVVNAKLANNPEKLALAKDFLKFMYTDTMLQEMTLVSGIPFALNYQLTDAQYKSMNTLSQSFWDVYEKAMKADSYLTCIGTSTVFKRNTARFSFKSTNDAFTATVDGAETGDILSYFYNKMKQNASYSVEAVFNGMCISSEAWKEYNK